MSHALALRSQITKPKIIVAPGAPDSLTARLIEQAGFQAVYMTGLGATAVRLGAPDLGFLTQTEMADHARNMIRAINLPVIVDADTGYGGPLNIQRTVEEYITAGVAALHLEDQVTPKRCGQLSGIRLTPVKEAVFRLKAAISARGTHEMLIIGRTDALPVHGIDEAASRAKVYQDAGVDLIFVDGVKTREEVIAISEKVSGPKIVSLVDGTDAANLHIQELEEMGFKIAIYPVTTLFAQARAGAEALSSIKKAGRIVPNSSDMTYDTFSNIVNLSGHQEFAGSFE